LLLNFRRLPLSFLTVNDFFFARSQMAMSLAFHIIFAALGIGLPVLMAIAEGVYLRTGKKIYLDLAQRWAKGAAILFAVGAVSGTVLSFELGLLWPAFMEKAGAIIGMPFSLEGFAFFTEAIFLGIYLYGWKKLKPFWHWISGVLVAISGIFSGIFVVTANAWMNAPAGFKIVNGKITDIRPIAAMLNPASAHEVVHMTLAALVATGFSVAAVHAFFLRRDAKNNFHRSALGIALALGCICIPLQIISGDISARAVARLQPVKLAAMEADYKTQTGAPLELGGVPDDNSETVRDGVEIPDGLSFLVEAVTPMPGLVAPFVTFTILYFFLAAIVIFLLRRQFLETAKPDFISELK
jgi:cytochrome d ubiquinol oxidase subunit I